MSHAGPAGRKAGRPAKISRPEIIAVARRIIDEQGVDALTMRSLAKELDTTSMALYYHVASKDDLLVMLLDDYAANLRTPELSEDPTARLTELSILMHDVLAPCPWIVRIIATEDMFAVSALWIVDDILGTAMRCGLDAQQAANLYRTVWYYTVGEILVRDKSTGRSRAAGRETYREEVFRKLDEQRLPHLAVLAGQWEQVSTRDAYAFGVLALISGLLAGYGYVKPTG